MGLKVYVDGETIAPAINEVTVFWQSLHQVTSTIVLAVKIVKGRESKVMSCLAQLADELLGKNKKNDVDNDDYLERQIQGNYSALMQLGTVFELTSLVFLDAIVSDLMEVMHQSESDLKARHAVLE